MQKRIFVVFLVIILGVPMTSFASSPKLPENITQGDFGLVNSYIHKLASYWVDEEEIVGLSIAVVSDNKVILNKGFGFSNIEDELPITQKTVFRVGAISGIFTAGLILKLAEMDLLKLDDSIDKYLPSLNIQYHDNKHYTVTIKNLLTHHAGLPLSRFEGSWTEEETEYRQLLTQLNHRFASYPPNKIYAYSNVAYSLLAIIVEEVTGKSFSDAMRLYILDPLKMFNTSMRYSQKIKSNLSTGYKKGEPKKLLFPRDIASLGIYTTTHDMTKLMRLMLQQGDRKVISKSSIQSMMRAHNTDVTLDLDKRIGFGVNVDGMNVTNGGPVVWRSGATLGFRARIALLPDHDVAVVVISNDTRAWNAIEDISEKTLQIMLQAKKGILQKSEAQKKSVDTLLTSENFSVYYLSLLGYVPFTKNEESITAKLLGWPLTVKPQNDGWFTLEYDLFGLIPIDVSWIADLKIKPSMVDNINIMVALYKGKKYLIGSHLPINKPKSSWIKRQGKYRIINEDALLQNMEISHGTLTVINEKMFFIYKIPNGYGQELQIPLSILSDKQAIISGLGTGLNEVVKVTKFGNKEYLEYSGYLLEKIKKKDSIFDVF